MARTLTRRGETSTGRFAWSTGAVGPDEQFAYWREVVCQAFPPALPEGEDSGPFAGEVRGRRFGPLTISRIASQAQQVRRSQALVDREAGDAVYLNLQLSGNGSASQDGRRAGQRPGDMVAVDTTRPFELGFEDDFAQLCVTLPLELLGPRLALPRAATAVPVAGDSGLGALLVNHLRLLAAPDAAFDREAEALIANQLAELLALALGRARSLPRSANRALLLQAALDRVEHELGDPGLSPPAVAGWIHVSTRHLHDLFAEQGTSFGRWVLGRRLERCHRELADPAHADLTIAAIATRSGFVDRSHFARAFRRRYGIAPREHRRLGAAAGAGAGGVGR